MHGPYAALCVACHLAPGVTKSDIRTGLYPHPPNLAQEDTRGAQRAFWTIKHGIKMSAMPAWGKTLDDTAIWDLVAFLQKLPALSPAAYGRLTVKHSSWLRCLQKHSGGAASHDTGRREGVNKCRVAP